MAQFSPKNERSPLISKGIIQNDVLKFMLYVLWELKGIEEKQFTDLSIRLEEIGRMLYGWRQRTEKETHRDFWNQGGIKKE